MQGRQDDVGFIVVDEAGFGGGARKLGVCDTGIKSGRRYVNSGTRGRRGKLGRIVIKTLLFGLGSCTICIGNASHRFEPWESSRKQAFNNAWMGRSWE